MKRLALVAVAAFTLVAAVPADTIDELQVQGYYIEPGAEVTASVVSDAVFEGRAAGGRLYIVVLADEPPGGATTFSDGVLDALGQGYVVTVAPDTVGWASDQSFWSDDEMDDAVDESLSGASDDDVVQRFTETLTGQDIGQPGDSDSSAGGTSLVAWLLIIGGGAFLFWFLVLRRSGRGAAAAAELANVKSLAREKLNEVANDVIEMESEVSTSGDPEVKAHYSRASATYSQALDDTNKATTAQQMLEVVEALDLAIWELDCAEALLDGKPKPAKPEPPRREPVVPMTPGGGVPPIARPGRSPVPGSEAPQGQGTVQQPDYDRRPERQSSGSGDMMSVLLGILMAQGMGRGGGMFGGGFSGRGLPSGGRRSSGGGFRMGGSGGGSRSRGGGRRRG